MHNFQEAGEYIVILISSNESCGGVSYADTLTVLQVSVDITKLEDLIKLYPNPTSGMVTLEIIKPFQSVILVEIINTQGQKIYSVELKTQEIHESVDLSRFPKGIYLVRVISKDWIRSGKLIIGD